jgi:hypothetical protein
MLPRNSGVSYSPASAPRVAETASGSHQFHLRLTFLWFIVCVSSKKFLLNARHNLFLVLLEVCTIILDLEFRAVIQSELIFVCGLMFTVQVWRSSCLLLRPSILHLGNFHQKSVGCVCVCVCVCVV